MKPDDDMSPDASPNTKIRKKPARANKKPVAITLIIVMVILVIGMYVAYEREQMQNRRQEEPRRNIVSTTGDARKWLSQYDTVYIPQDEEPEITKAAEPKPVAAAPLPAPPMLIATAQAPSPVQPPVDPYADEKRRWREQRAAFIRQGILSETKVTGFDELSNSTAPAGYAATGAMSATDAYQIRMRQLEAAGLLPAVGGELMGASLLQPVGGIGNDAFGKFAQTGSWKLDSALERPQSLFEIHAGFIIPAILVSGINSDLPGHIVAQVSKNVYDSPSGKYLLIPQGSLLIGRYENEVEYGQNRVLVAWQRIEFPDGKNIDIGSMPGATGSGYSGFKDKVNHHYMRVFGSALMMSMILAGVELTQNSNSSGRDDGSSTQRMSDTMSESLGQTFGNTMAQMIAKNLNISPTIEIRPGYPFHVFITKDMRFEKPYEAFDY